MEVTWLDIRKNTNILLNEIPKNRPLYVIIKYSDGEQIEDDIFELIESQDSYTSYIWWVLKNEQYYIYDLSCDEKIIDQVCKHNVVQKVVLIFFQKDFEQYINQKELKVEWMLGKIESTIS